jgi:hypothetical protein
MKPIWKFRLLALLIVLIVGTVSIANLAADVVRPTPPPVSALDKSPTGPDAVSAMALATMIAPFREDLRAEEAAMRAAAALSSDAPGAAANGAARSAVKAALRIGPHDARMWLTLALLEARAHLSDGQIAESLKMSYLTGPTQVELIPARLDLVSSINALGDSDLQELAASDVRAILTRFAALRPLLLKAYARASAPGRQLLENSAKSVDPAFAATMSGTYLAVP